MFLDSALSFRRFSVTNLAIQQITGYSDSIFTFKAQLNYTGEKRHARSQ